MRSPATRLANFADFLSRGQTRPNRKGLRDALFGLAGTGNCILSGSAEFLALSSNPESTLHRLSGWFNNQTFDLDLAWDQYHHRLLRHLRRNGGAGVTIPVDYTGIEHRGARTDARGMEGISRCWHGSRGTQAPGHPHVLVQAVTEDGLHVPLFYGPWDRTGPDYRNDHEPFLKAIERLAWLPGGGAIFALDRGFHTRTYAPLLDGANLRFVVRLSLSGQKKQDEDGGGAGGVTLAGLDGVPVRVTELVKEAPTVVEILEQRCRDRRRGRGPRRVQVCALPVRATQRKTYEPIGPIRTLIATFTETDRSGSEPMALLADRRLEGAEEVLEYVRAYRDRWAIELTIRQGKNRAGFGLHYEDTRSLRWTGIERKAFLVAVYQGFLGELAWTGAKSPRVVEPLLSRVWTSAADPKDLRYRLARGMQRYLQERVRQEFRRRERAQLRQPARAWELLVGEVAA